MKGKKKNLSKRAKKKVKKLKRKQVKKYPVKSDKSFVKRKIKVKKKKSPKKTTRHRTAPKIVKKFSKALLVKRIKKRKVTKFSARRSITRRKPDYNFSAKNFFKAKIKVIGVGGGGGSIVSEIRRSLNKATFVVADTDIRSFRKKSGIKYFLFGQKLTHGLGTGSNPDLAIKAAEQEKERITKLFKDQDIIIFVASLGGGVGSGTTQIFAEISKNLKGVTFGIFTLPFKFEGENKSKIAKRALSQLKKYLNVSITIPNERIFKVIQTDTAITEAFSIINKSLIESLESLIDLIYNPGVINIDFADLRTVLKGKGNLAFLNSVEASGKDRTEEIIKEILYNPLYQNNNFMVQKVLYDISGDKNLGMSEVDKISRAIAEVNPKAKIIFGISKNPKYKNKIKTTILTVGPSILRVIPKIQSKKSVDNKLKKVIKRARPKYSFDELKSEKEKITFSERLAPVFSKMPAENETTQAGLNKLSVVDISEAQWKDSKKSLSQSLSSKKAIRRTALEIRKAQEIEESKKSTQEKEWEIPAFLRKAHRIK